MLNHTTFSSNLSCLLVPSNESLLLSYPNGSFDPYCPTAHQQKHENEKALIFALCIAIGLLCLVGVCAGILALLATWPRRTGLSGVPLLVFHLVLTNLITIFFVYPSHIIMIQLTQNGFAPSPNVCLFLSPFDFALQNLVNWTEVVLALNRFVALFFPHHYRTWTRRSANVCLLVLVWLISASVAYPILIARLTRVSTLGQCMIDLSQHTPLRIPLSIVTYTPLAVCGASAFTTLWSACRRKRAVGGGEMATRKTALRRLKMAGMLLLVFVWNTTCYLISIVVSRYFGALWAHSVASWVWVRVISVTMYAATPVGIPNGC